ncbi:SWIRM domain-containing protein NDAI_0H01210 [Naumovozyma dairenensis CBS 421]|uniref:SWIRM domain-containing protein n=1 Tax=Naumovozyma dairenensis (strain ATCC 10597 / BCRC 20456 / CBS 421 / NBRC 0211 / NRRL Y-12639) TaxID=1071378 RepID=G0WET4_NAUDC|nr:hypothetical protein NDAI_0H01210 [Naumovozyma dairenensis CBS 421]CCD26295.1 hypothetical protein NDAI_0H01210 [Naumovozyma dairenensis CBS 421]
MIFNSPQTHYTQLYQNDKQQPKNIGHKNILTEEIPKNYDNKHEEISASTIDSILDEQIIPSPPLSPTLNSKTNIDSNPYYNLEYDSMENEIKRLDDDIDVFYLTPSWLEGMSMDEHNKAMIDFLSQYKVFHHLRNIGKSGYNFKAKRNSTANFPNRRHHKTSVTFSPSSSSSSTEPISSSYNLRHKRNKKGKATNEELDDLPLITHTPRRNIMAKRKRTSKTAPSHHHSNVKFKRNPFRYHSTPAGTSNQQHLASFEIISKVPQYIPNESWKLIPNYCPSTSEIPQTNINCLKIEWKGSPMDLSNDPLKEQLHPAELKLAEILRLPCDLYLDSKRRLFLEKFYRFKNGLPFRRTDAQKACKIDVNKASRLYAAFEKIGWFNDSQFGKFIT